MAEIPMNGQGGSPAQERNLATITNYAGAALSLALIVGVGIWGYKILARDVSGVPVVRAATGEPMRVAPKDPGGSSAAHQGLSVNKVVSGAGAQKPADRLVLAPKPVVLTEEDTPPAAMQAANAEQEEAAGADAASEELTPQMASIQALADEIAGDASRLGAAPKEDGAAEAKATPAAAAAPEAAPKETSGQAAEAVTNSFGPSLRPQLRPAAFKPQVAAAADAQEEAPVSVPAGTRLVQLGAFDAADVARDEWVRLSGRFEDYMDGKTRVVQRAESGGRVFYRLRAMGFADLSDARRFCAALKAQKADCIPVVAK